jgi:hypothetical protein
MLRAYKAGKPFPKILGHIHLSPFFGWPWLDGPALAGAAITISNPFVNLKTTTDAMGRFSLQNAPPGEYTVRADLAPYHMDADAIRPSMASVNGHLRVPEAGCGYTEVQLATTSSIDGIVLDPLGKGAPKIPVFARMRDGSPLTHGVFAVTGQDGRFTLSGVPDANVYLSAGVDSDFLSGGTNLDLDMRYLAVYYPAGSTAQTASPLRLKLGEKRSAVLRLRTPLQWTRVDVKVVDKNGRARAGAYVNAYGGPPRSETTTTGRQGLGSLPCLAGWKYKLDASAFGEHRRPDGKTEVFVASPTPWICGDRKAPVVLVLDHTSRGIVAGQMVDSKGVALGFPAVQMYRDDETIPRYEARGDGKGQFRIEDVDPGLYTIHLSLGGFGEKTLAKIDVTAGLTNLGAVVWTLR